LYNSVQWMEIGIQEGTLFNPLPTRKEKPIVVYGTSIAQGGCASRPGMAWPAILGRKLDRPLINLGFSGNGRLEKEVIDLMIEIDAKLFVLDCLPNLDASDVTKSNSLDRKTSRLQFCWWNTAVSLMKQLILPAKEMLKRLTRHSVKHL
jgi:GDSL-like Lipase/Acylhydrolase family